MAGIFICYRRQDSQSAAGRLHDALLAHFGKRDVFIDVDSLHPGVDFKQVIQSTLGRVKVVLVVIGLRWVDPRLKDEDDWVRLEILAALKGKMRLIPVLVEGARMPKPEKLPPELAPLAGKNAVTLHHPTWQRDVQRLVASLERILARAKSGVKTPTPSTEKKLIPSRKAKKGKTPVSAGKIAERGKPAAKRTTAKDGKPAVPKAAEGRGSMDSRNVPKGPKADTPPAGQARRKRAGAAGRSPSPTGTVGGSKSVKRVAKPRPRKDAGADPAATKTAKRIGTQKSGERVRAPKRAPGAAKPNGMAKPPRNGQKRGGKP